MMGLPAASGRCQFSFELGGPAQGCLICGKERLDLSAKRSGTAATFKQRFAFTYEFDQARLGVGKFASERFVLRGC